MDNIQKHNSFNTNTPSSESYKNYLTSTKCQAQLVKNTQMHVLSLYFSNCFPFEISSI